MSETWFEAVEKDFQASGKTVPRIATEFDVCHATVYNWKRGEQPFPFAHLGKWADLTGAHHIMRWAGRTAGYFIAPIPEPESTVMETIPDLLREFADIVSAVNSALADGHITNEEAENVWTQGEELIEAVYATMLSTKAKAKKSQRGRGRVQTLREAG